MDQRYSHHVQALPMGYKPKGKAGRFTVAHSWSMLGQGSTRYLDTTYHATAAAAEAYAARLRASLGL